MASPQFGTPTIISYGNGGSTVAGPPSIDSRVYTGFSGILQPPNLTDAPRLPILERITPRSVPAGRMIQQRRAQARMIARDTRRRTTDLIIGYARALRMRVG